MRIGICGAEILISQYSLQGLYRNQVKLVNRWKNLNSTGQKIGLKNPNPEIARAKFPGNKSLYGRHFEAIIIAEDRIYLRQGALPHLTQNRSIWLVSWLYGFGTIWSLRRQYTEQNIELAQKTTNISNITRSLAFLGNQLGFHGLYSSPVQWPRGTEIRSRNKVGQEKSTQKRGFQKCVAKLLKIANLVDKFTNEQLMDSDQTLPQPLLKSDSIRFGSGNLTRIISLVFR